jgi:DNA-binding response OmpR family regulator
MPNTRQILIVEDDPQLRDALTEQLRCTRSSKL